MGLHIPVLVAAVSSILLFQMRSLSRRKNTCGCAYKLKILVQLDFHLHPMLSLEAPCGDRDLNRAFFAGVFPNQNLQQADICFHDTQNSNCVNHAGEESILFPVVPQKVLELVVWRSACARSSAGHDLADIQHAVGLPDCPAQAE